jgi:acetate kinase
MSSDRPAAGRVLVLNAGSSSLKWSVLSDASEPLSQGSVDWRPDSPDEALEPVLRDLSGIDAVGHRLVHGGAEFSEPTRITPEVVERLETLVEIDPLHTPPALAGIAAIRRAAPSLLQVAAFDTAFHRFLPQRASTYAIPWEWTERWKLRRYGFHGLSVDYAVRRTAELLGEHPRRLIVAHLGSGCSLTAVADGKSVDTTMGFTPLDGVVMGTRPGALDPGLLLFLRRHSGLSQDELETAIETRSGLLGISGSTGDVRGLTEAAEKGDTRAALSLEVFEHSVRRALGALTAVLDGVDALVFTGGIGEHSARVRAQVVRGLAFAGLRLEPAANEAHSTQPDAELSAPTSLIRVLRITAREDLSILRAVREVQARD